VIKDHDCSDMIKPSRSCASTWERTSELTHCGICSQCVDRRVAMIATEMEEFDPVGQYELDIVKESILEEKARIMMVSYFERANEFRSIKTADQLLEKYSEVADALPYADKNPDSALGKILSLHQRHAAEVRQAAVSLLQRHADDLFGRSLPDDCLVRILNDTNSATVLPAVAASEKTNGDGKPADDSSGAPATNGKIHLGRMAYLPGFNDVWLDGVYINMARFEKARLVLQCLADNKAHDVDSAMHLVDEIDVYVRNNSEFPKLRTVKIADYFKGGGGQPKKIRDAVIRSASNGKYYWSKGSA